MNANPSTKQGLNGLGPAEDRQRVFLPVVAFVLMALCWTTSGSAEGLSDDKRYFNIPQQRADLSLTQFAEQAGLTLLFKFNIAKRKTANNLTGHYTVNEAVEVLLADTGLHPVFSDQGQLMSVSDDMPEVEGDSMDTKKKTGVVAVLAGVLAGSVNAQEPTVSEAEIQTSIVTGKVTDARTGANLKGAKITIEETSQWTSTNDLGEFRFVNVPTGSVTLTVSYLGYAGQSAVVGVRGDDISQDFALRGGSEIEEIVVFGQRSARALALNQERTAENVSTVLSSDQLGNFAGTTLSESLRRAPGVVFERDPATGDGANIAIRGLGPDLNTIKFNGVELPEGSGTGRTASLSNVLTESIDTVTIHKTLLPNHDSSGTGGLVEIETKTPLDRPRRFASITVEAAERAADFNEERLLAGTVSGTFGANDQFGLSGSIQYRDRELKRVQYRTDIDFLLGQYLPLQIDGTTGVTATAFIDPRRAFPFDADADEIYPTNLQIGRAEVDTSNLAYTISAAAAIGDHTALTFDYQRLDQEDTEFRSSLSLIPTMGYSLQPVNSLGGEDRYALVWQNNQVVASPNYVIFPDQETVTDLYSLRGITNFNQWTLRYLVGHTTGETETPGYGLNSPFSANLTTDQIDPSAVHPTERRVISPFGNRAAGNRTFPEPLLTAAGFDVINDPALYAFSSATEFTSLGENDRTNAEFSARYSFEGARLGYLEAGASFESSEFSDAQPLTIVNLGIGSPSLADFGLDLSRSSLSDIGVDTQISQIDRSAVVGFLVDDVPSMAEDCNPFDPSNPCSPDATLWRRIFERDPQLLREKTKEDESVGYLQGAVTFGRLEIVGGVRISRVDIETINLNAPNVFDENFIEDIAFREANTRLISQRATQTDYLPRLLANYRWNDNLVIRGGYYQSIARPQIALLSETPNIFLFLAPVFGPNGNLPRLSIGKGNPDLKPAQTHSFDLSVELYNESLGVLKLGGFYKRIDNLLESTVTVGEVALDEIASVLPDDSRFQDVIDNPDNYSIVVGTPVNNTNESVIWGLEVAAERQFTSLPGMWGGFGVFGNYTYTDSEKEQPGIWTTKPVLDSGGTVVGFESEEYVIRGVRFDGQAEHSGTFGISYNQYDIDASLAYTGQSRRQLNFKSFNLHDFEEAFETLDFRAEYRFDAGPGTYRFYLEGLDLLRDQNDAALEGSIGANDRLTPKYFNSARYFGGRQFRLGVIGTF